jgi:hypothetical protein
MLPIGFPSFYRSMQQPVIGNYWDFLGCNGCTTGIFTRDNRDVSPRSTLADPRGVRYLTPIENPIPHGHSIEHMEK